MRAILEQELDILLFGGAKIIEIRNPINFFSGSNGKEKLEEIIGIVRRFHEREYIDDIEVFRRIVGGQRVFLFEKESDGIARILAAASYDQIVLSGLRSLIIREFSTYASIPKKRLFKKITEMARDKGEIIVCMRAENPDMYAEFKKYCYQVYFDEREMPPIIKGVEMDLTEYFRTNCLEYGMGNLAIGVK